MNNFDQFNFTQKEWDSCIKVLKALKDNPLDNPDNQLLGTLITKIHKTAKKQLKKDLVFEQLKSDDLDLIKASTIAKNALDKVSLFSDTHVHQNKYTDLNFPHSCYVCQNSFLKSHAFYHRLCPTCAELNYENRFIPIDLTGRNVILTGGRVKVGYATALRLLKSNANLTITTRFPALALAQFQKENNYDLWKNNLLIYGLDLRNLQAVNTFINFYKSKNTSLDILINNAAQTIGYPKAYYLPLIKKELQLLSSEQSIRLISNSTPITKELTTIDSLDHKTQTPNNRFGQPVDFRDKNSWNSTLEEITTQELLEVNLINHISPFELIKAFTPLFKASNFQEKFIINVTSSEGIFSYENKTIFHPHTNMTKAALNMMTLTAAEDYAKYNIFMNSVDVGWISTGANETKRAKQFEKGYIPPLDSVDGAARIIHPMYEAIKFKNYIFGKLIKNYKISDW